MHMPRQDRTHQEVRRGGDRAIAPQRYLRTLEHLPLQPVMENRVNLVVRRVQRKRVGHIVIAVIHGNGTVKDSETLAGDCGGGDLSEQVFSFSSVRASPALKLADDALGPRRWPPNLVRFMPIFAVPVACALTTILSRFLTTVDTDVTMGRFCVVGLTFW